MKSVEHLPQGLSSVAITIGAFGISGTIQPAGISNQAETVSYQCAQVPLKEIVWASRDGVSGGLVKSKPGARKDTYFIPMGNYVRVDQFSQPTGEFPDGRLLDQKTLDELKLSKTHPKVEVTFRDQYFKTYGGERHYSYVHIDARWGHGEFRPKTYSETVSTCVPEI